MVGFALVYIQGNCLGCRRRQKKMASLQSWAKLALKALLFATLLTGWMPQLLGNKNHHQGQAAETRWKHQHPRFNSTGPYCLLSRRAASR